MQCSRNPWHQLRYRHVPPRKAAADADGDAQNAETVSDTIPWLGRRESDTKYLRIVSMPPTRLADAIPRRLIGRRFRRDVAEIRMRHRSAARTLRRGESPSHG